MPDHCVRHGFGRKPWGSFMKKYLAFLAVFAFTVLLAFSAQASDARIKPNAKISDFTALSTGSIAAGDYVLGWDASARGGYGAWVKFDATTLPIGGAFNGTVGAVTPAAGAFTTLSATGATTFDDGSGASPSITIQDGTDETVVLSKVDAGYLTATTDATDGLNILTGNLKVGNGTPGVTLNGEDAYVEGTFEVDGAQQFDGATVFGSTLNFGTGAWTVNSVTVNTLLLQKQGRGQFTVCGDATTVNNNTVYYGPDQTIVSSATIGMTKCDTTAAGNTTEATADTPALAGTAIYPLGMVCYADDPNATLTFTLRATTAAITPAISVSIADNITSGTASATATSAIAADAPVDVAVASTSDVGTVHFICRVNYAF